MKQGEIERAAALVRQYPIEHPAKLDRWPYAAVPRPREHSLSHDLAIIGLILLMFAIVGLFGGLH